MKMEEYELPKLAYGYDALEPHMSSEQLGVHHDKHHAAYVKKANAALERMQNARDEDQMLVMNSELKDLSFNLGGHILHSLFWRNLSPRGGGQPDGKLLDAIEKQYGSFKQFQAEFESACLVEGSGWAALAYDPITEKMLLMQIEKHNQNLMPTLGIVLVLDMWEHAYYIDHKNEKAKHVEAFWKLVDWKEAGERLERISGWRGG